MDHDYRQVSYRESYVQSDPLSSFLFFLTKCSQGPSVCSVACVKFEYITRCMLSMSSMKCDNATDYTPHFSTVFKTQKTKGIR